MPEITISIIENGEEIAQSSAESFEVAEMSLGSLERWYEKYKTEKERLEEENN